MLIEVDTVKGFRDYLAPESIQRDFARKVVENQFKNYGFIPLETPLIEFDELMKPNTLPNEEEDEAVGDRFRLKDRAGRNLGLRYEFTFQLARIFKLNPNIKLPFRRYQIDNVFRDEHLRAGRTRQFTQCDIDIVGDPSTQAEAEVIAVMKDIFSDLKVYDYEIQVNSRKLLNAIIESCEITSKKEIMRELDKLTKLGEDVVKTNLRKYADANTIITLFKLMEKDLQFFLENKFDGANDISALIKSSKYYGLKLKFVPSMIRGFGYYTGNIFEFVPSGKNTTLAGGGRYDRTVGKYLGKEIPAVGISFSIESLMGLCEDSIKNWNIPALPKSMIISINQEAESIRFAKLLRSENISCLNWYDKIGKAMEYANSYQIPYVIFVGEEEVLKKKFKLKNMKSGEEKLLTDKQIISKLKKI